MVQDKLDIKSLDAAALEKAILRMGQKAFRARQLYEWMHVRLAASFEEMTNLSKEFRRTLQENCLLRCATIIQKQVSEQDGTAKYLMELADGNVVESVLMKYRHGNSVCISTQVGCRMGCRFCASTVGGLVRNLRISEMLDQIYEIQRETGSGYPM